MATPLRRSTALQVRRLASRRRSQSADFERLHSSGDRAPRPLAEAASCGLNDAAMGDSKLIFNGLPLLLALNLVQSVLAQARTVLLQAVA